MYSALGAFVVLGLLSWFTIDRTAVLHVTGFSAGALSIGDRDVPVRWLPLLFLGLFAFRTVLANMRARLEQKDQQEG